jgi:MarR family transcriptional regulator, lower aerobic nicotinate degradation pathway regulator
VLAYLGDAGPAAQRDIGRLLGIDPSDMVGAVDHLERRGYAARGRDPRDRRRYLITLTEAGKTVLRRCQAAAGEIAAGMFAPLSADERDRLAELLGRVFDRL